MSLLGGLFGGLLGGGGGGQAGIGNKSNESTTNNSTTNQYSDTSTNAGGDNSIAVGSGASLNIQNLSEGVAKDAIDTTGAVASHTADLNTLVAEKALDTGLQQTAFTVNTIAGLQEASNRQVQDAQNSADLAVRSTQGLANQITSLAQDAVARTQAPDATSLATILKPMLWAIAGIAVVALVVWGGRKKK